MRFSRDFKQYLLTYLRTCKGCWESVSGFAPAAAAAAHDNV